MRQVLRKRKEKQQEVKSKTKNERTKPETVRKGREGTKTNTTWKTDSPAAGGGRVNVKVWQVQGLTGTKDRPLWLRLNGVR